MQVINTSCERYSPISITAIAAVIAFVLMAGSPAKISAQTSSTICTTGNSRIAKAAIPPVRQLAGLAPMAPPTTYSVVATFMYPNGNVPYMESLVQGKDGNLYGTTAYGGDGNGGTTFNVTPSGIITTLHTFGDLDGQNPDAGLLLALDGNYYGTTYLGGLNEDGNIFKMTPKGIVTSLYSFDGADGGCPTAGLIQGPDQSLYGTTSGTIFKITTAGVLTTLADNGSTGGLETFSALQLAADGNLYGTSSAVSGYDGAVYKITPGGNLSNIFTFDGASGSDPESALIQTASGNFYGTTYVGGAYNYGEVFELTPAGKLKILHSFNLADGAAPTAALLQATDGNFYGTTVYGGANGAGTIFQITPGGVLTTLYNFCYELNCGDGQNPYAGLMQHTSGVLYGVTSAGGFGRGAIFSLNMGLGPFVITKPTSGKVGSSVIILGTGLTGTTSVTFNGTTARFNVVSDTEIITTIPAGATTGAVEVITPANSLQSNTKFRVIP